MGDWKAKITLGTEKGMGSIGNMEKSLEIETERKHKIPSRKWFTNCIINYY